MAPCLFSLLFQIYSIAITSVLSASYLHSFGDLTESYWQWVANRINYDIINTYNNSCINNQNIIWTKTPSYSTPQFLVLKQVYLADNVVYQHSNLQLDLIHVNSEWNSALQQSFAIWPLNITTNWADLYPSFILKHSVHKTQKNRNTHIITNTTQFISKPNWIDFPVLFYNSELLSIWGDINDITSWHKLFDAAKTVQFERRNEGYINFWGYLFSFYQEDITCTLLEFISAFGGGNIIEEDGVISIDNENATKALELMGQYFGDITDPNCLAYNEQDVLDQFISGNALFVRGWYSRSLSYLNYYSQAQTLNGGELIHWNISRLPGYGTLGGVSLALNNNNNATNYFDFAQHTTSFETSLYRWTQTQIIPPYKEFLDNFDSMTYCNHSYVNGINICSLDLSNLTSYLVSRPSYVNVVGQRYYRVSDIIQSEVHKYLITNNYNASYSLRMIKCRLQYLLYSSTTLKSAGCGTDIEVDDVLKALCYLVSIILILICFILIVLISIHNDHPAILSTSVTFSILLNLGALSMSISIICATINPYNYQYSCVMQHILYHLGFALMFGSMFCSYRRVKQIFDASEACAVVHIRDFDVLKTTGYVLLGECLCLLLWFMLDAFKTDNSYLHYQMIMVNEKELTYYYQCYLNPMGYLVINIYNTILVCYGMVLAWKTRHIRYIAFRQSYVYSVIASLFFFTVIIVHPMYFYCVQSQSVHTPNLAVLIYCLSALFLILGTVVLIFSYKIYLLFKFDAEVLRKEFLIPKKNTFDTINSIIEYSKSTKVRRHKVNAQHPLTTGLIDENDKADGLSLFSLDFGGNGSVDTNTINSGYRFIPNSYAQQSGDDVNASDSMANDFIFNKYDVEKLRKLGWIITPPTCNHD